MLAAELLTVTPSVPSPALASPLPTTTVVELGAGKGLLGLAVVAAQVGRQESSTFI